MIKPIIHGIAFQDFKMDLTTFLAQLASIIRGKIMVFKNVHF